MIERLAALFAPWQALYSESTALATTILALHLVGLLLAGGLAIAADRGTLLVLHLSADQRYTKVEDLHRVHRPVLVALAAVVSSGLLMFAADVEVYLTSAVFWTKMVLIVLLLVNGSVLYGTGARILSYADRGADQKLWNRLGYGARISLTLWLAITIAGAVLSSVG